MAGHLYNTIEEFNVDSRKSVAERSGGGRYLIQSCEDGRRKKVLQ